MDDFIGPSILERTLLVKRSFGDRPPRPLHYHPRSDHHSNVACFAVMVDLIRHSDALRRDIEQGRLVMGINAVLRDHVTARKKTLDLVVGKPSPQGRVRGKAKSLTELVGRNDIVLSDAEAREVDRLPHLPTGAIGAGVRIAVEAKACMTAHQKARPRLYDELTSSHLTVHGNDQSALACAVVMVNTSPVFVSPTHEENTRLQAGDVATMSEHPQPEATVGILEKLGELLVRGHDTNQAGFDGLGLFLVDTDNDERGFKLVRDEIYDARVQERFKYESMIQRVANAYDGRFGSF